MWKNPTSVTTACDEWPLSIAPWKKFYNSHGKYKPELNEYFHMYRCQLNFAMFCTTGVGGISLQHFNHPNLFVRTVYRLYVSFHVRLILQDLDCFSKVKNFCIKSAYYSICDDYGVNPDERWMHGNWFYTTDYGFIRRIMVFLVTK